MTGAEFQRWARRFPEPLLLADTSGRVLGCNQSACELLSSTREQLSQATLVSLTHSPEQVESALRIWSRTGQLTLAPLMLTLGENKLRLQCEGAVLEPQQGEQPALLLVRLRSHDLAVNRFVALNRKMHELAREVRLRRESEVRLRQQREWLRVTLSSIGDAVIATNLDGHVDFMNEVAETLTGWQMNEALGKPLTEVFNILNEESRARVRDPSERVIREGTVVGLGNHTLLVSRDGTERPIEDSAAPIRDAEGRVMGVVLVFHDVSDRRQADRALRASERRFRLWVEANIIGAAVLDMRGALLEANQAFSALLGYTAEELSGGKLNAADLTPAEYQGRDHAALQEALASGACQPYEKEFLRKDGTRVPVIFGFAVFQGLSRYAAQTSDELCMCFALDISERKRAEEVLERRVNDRTVKLREAIAELEAFSYTISHDLRAPLRSMQGYANILAEEYGQALGEVGLGYVNRIQRSGEHLNRLVTDVLNYSRVSRAEITLEPVNLDRLVEELSEHYPYFSLVEITHPLGSVQGSHALLVQCLSNLIGNAIKFVDPGVVPRVKLWTDVEDATRRIFVQDNGIGINPEDLSRIFGIFERGHGAERFEGTGVGLSIVRKAVQRMGGRIRATSTPGQGSTFCIELPMA